MRKPPQPWHGVAWKGLLHRKQVPSALVRSRRVTRVSALPHRTQNASWTVMVLVYLRFAASFPLLRSGEVPTDAERSLQGASCSWASREAVNRVCDAEDDVHGSPEEDDQSDPDRSADAFGVVARLAVKCSAVVGRPGSRGGPDDDPDQEDHLNGEEAPEEHPRPAPARLSRRRRRRAPPLGLRLCITHGTSRFVYCLVSLPVARHRRGCPPEEGSFIPGCLRRIRSSRRIH